MPTRADPAALEAPERVAPAATFHARVAGVGLITTVVVLIATILLAGFVSMWDFICTYVINFITSFGR